MYQLELKGEKTLSENKLKFALEESLSPELSDDSVKVHKFSNIGNGCVLVSISPVITVILIWDGRKHVDINLTVKDD